jgi:GNAT superfamily N-acetyltransferase
MEFVIEDIDDRARLWLQNIRLAGGDNYEGAICRAFEGETEIGQMAIDEEGLILYVEVKPMFRRRGVATEMFRQLEDAGLAPLHDWQNLTDAAADWARSLPS